MQRLASCLVACFVVASCAGGGPTSPDGPVSVRYGERVRVEDLAVTFAEVVGDSRCPTNVQCIWAGDAAIRIVIEEGSRKDDVTLHTHGGANFPNTAQSGRYQITLLDLVPAPGEQKPQPSAYIARLEIKPLTSQ
jgi:hypothetical protein